MEFSSAFVQVACVPGTKISMLTTINLGRPSSMVSFVQTIIFELFRTTLLVVINNQDVELDCYSI